MITNAMSISLAYHFLEKLLCSALPFYPPPPDTAAPLLSPASRQTCSWAHNSCCVATPQLICYIRTASAVCFVSRESKYFQSVQKLVICKSVWLRMMFPRSLNKDLYGPSRVTANTAIKDILLRDHVLQEGEWYSDIAKQKPWTTSFAISFEVGDKSLFSFFWKYFQVRTKKIIDLS